MPGVRAGSQFHLRGVVAKESVAARIDEIHERAGRQARFAGPEQTLAIFSDKPTTMRRQRRPQPGQKPGMNSDSCTPSSDSPAKVARIPVCWKLVCALTYRRDVYPQSTFESRQAPANSQLKDNFQWLSRTELMNGVRWYPLRFEPIFQYRPWGGRRLANVLSTRLPGDEPVGEAWLLSDRDEYPSRIADGPLAGSTIADLIRDSPQQLLGAAAAHLRRFPLLLKFLDVCDRISVQVHPADDQTALLPQGESGKTEAWVVLHSGAAGRIYAGLNPRSTAEDLRRFLATRTMADHLATFTPQTGDAVLLPAGTVHSLRDTVVFEVQQNSDVTFRLDDWDRIDARTGRRRPLQVAQALACVTFPQGAIAPVLPLVEAASPVLRERLLLCEHFGVWRLHGASSFPVGRHATARLLVCSEGGGTLVHDGAE